MKYYGLLLLMTGLIASGCAPPEIDEVMLATQLQGAQQAINNAAALEAEPLVPDEFGRAVKLLKFARNSQEKGDIPQSAEFAYQAELVAQIASAKARQHQARKNTVALQEQIYQQIIKGHEHELEIGRIREAFLEERLARALRAKDKGQEQTEQLSTEITDLKTDLRQAELRLSLKTVESLVDLSKYAYPAIETTADYANVQASIASITTLISQETFDEAAEAISETQQRAESLYELAKTHQQAAAAARTAAHVAIAKAEGALQRAKALNAPQHAPQSFQEATRQLNRAKQALANDRYEPAQQAAQQAQQTAEETVVIAEAAEFRQRAQKALDEQAAAAQQAVDTLKRELTAQAKTEVPQLEARLYELARTAHTKAKTALANKEYEMAVKLSTEGSNYLGRATANAQQITSVKSDLVKAAKQIPKAVVTEQQESVLIRIQGNTFAYGSTQLQKDFSATFEHLARVLRRENFSSYPVRIEVHTSALGNANVNRNVSIGRADVIKRVLVEERVNPERLTVVGLGETQPIVEQGQNKAEQNRRIDVIIKTN